MLRSSIPSANTPDTSFPLNNLPYVSFSPPSKTRRVGVAIGGKLLDLSALTDSHPEIFTSDFPHETAVEVLTSPTLNALLALTKPSWTALRALLQAFLSEANPHPAPDLLYDIAECRLHLPADVPDYTDFYSSITHARNVGTMFRGPEKALLPNWLHMPIAYHGRSSSVIVSGESIHRPRGQLNPDGTTPTFGACRLLDFELEVAVLLGGEGTLGKRVKLEEAHERIFGFVLMNDWSARDIQKWEYVPLGPFGAKNFATTISPFVVPLEALEPFRRKPMERLKEELPYLKGGEDVPGHCVYDVDLEVCIQQDKEEPSVVCRSNMKNLYWTVAQQVAHHSVTGCNMRPGDLLASGTISGKEESSYGSLLELSWKGTKEVVLENCEKGTIRKFLRDGDTVVIRGGAKGDGYRIGFGECVGKILPALDD